MNEKYNKTECCLPTYMVDYIGRVCTFKRDTYYLSKHLKHHFLVEWAIKLSVGAFTITYC